MSVAAGLREVRARIAAAAQAAGRDPSAITLVAVSKFHDAAAIREAYAEGQRVFGESYVQELTEKRHALSDLPDLQFHFVGHLQRNKARALLAGGVAAVETVDRRELVTELEKRLPAGARLPVFLEANLGGEASKHGATAAEIPALVAAITASERLNFQGFMTIPPDDPRGTTEAFTALAALRESYARALGRPLRLSMGMSGDLEEAIARGADIVRVGTAIFGARR